MNHSVIEQYEGRGKALETAENAELSGRCTVWLDRSKERQQLLLELDGEQSQQNQTARAVHLLHGECHAAYNHLVQYIQLAEQHESLRRWDFRNMLLETQIEQEGSVSLRQKIQEVDRKRADILEKLETLFGERDS